VTTDVVIVGGGLAGSAAAIDLAKAGRRVVLVERSAEAHHKVCGEFLSGEALGYLHDLGVDVVTLGAVPIRAVRLAGGGVVSSAALPFLAMSLTRRRLDEAMLEAAQQAGVQILRGNRVEGLERESRGWTASLDSGASLTADVVFLATGKHDLRGRPRVRSWKQQDEMVGFKMYFRLARFEAEALSGHVELVTYPGGYGGLQPVEDGAANLCCLVERRRLRQLGGRWENFVEMMKAHCPHLQQRLAGAEALLPRALAITSIPYGYLRAQTEDGLWALGDQAAVIPSFTGDGMSIALHSGRLAAAMYVQSGTSRAFQRRLRGEVAGPVRLARLISRGLVRSSTQGYGIAAVQRWPWLLGTIARRTRIPEKARRYVVTASLAAST
jgi:flavin-dependent dehydrogenase